MGSYDSRLASAIAQRKLVEFTYGRHTRVVEPHVLGTHDRVLQLLAYQVGGTSSSGGLPEWRRFDVDKILNLRVLSDTFSGPRDTNPFKNSEFDVLHAVVK